MKETSNHPSLLSYLHIEHGKIGLRIHSETAAHSPFPLISNSDPLARIIKAAFVSDNGSIIRETCLLVQRDSITHSAARAAHLNNVIIERCWQKSGAIQKERLQEHCLRIADQVDKQGNLQPLAPLFFCQKKHQYFEPPCPFCGRTLQLCREDDILLGAALQPYTSSLRRYLYCPSCVNEGREERWFAKESVDGEPATVLDKNQLILHFATLNPELEIEGGLPCPSCEQKDQCYSQAQTPPDVMHALAFYPFYLLFAEHGSSEGFHFFDLFETIFSPGFAESEHRAPASTPSQAGSEKENNDQNSAIYTILQGLGAKWRSQDAEKEIPPAGTHSEINTMDTQSPEGLAPDQAGPLKTESTLAGTLPIGNDNFSDFSEETVLIGSSGSGNDSADDTLQMETVMLSENFDPEREAEPPQAAKPADDATDDEYDLDETVVLKPGEKS